MREWIEELSDWMKRKEKISVSTDLSNELEQTTHETIALLEAADHFQTIYSQIKGKIDHDLS